MENLVPEHLTFSEVGHLPIIKDFAKKIKLVETLDTMVDSEMELSPGVAIMAMVLDTLSGRTPLYRMEEFFQEKDTELMLGCDVKPELFCDYNIGRVLDKIFETGTQKVFSQIAQNAIGVFDVDVRRLHYDTTSISVFGDYDFTDPPLKITYGHSKDKRPDLKQFLISMLCVDRNIPILGTCEDGNASDKTLNNELLGGVSKHMARHGLKPGAFVYVADSAFVTPDNLKKSRDKNVKILTRLPATYKECSRAISEAVTADNWIDFGQLNQTPATKNALRRFTVDLKLLSNSMMRLTAPSSFTLLLMTSAVINVSIDSWRKNARILKLTVKRSTQDLFIARPTLRRQPKKLQKPLRTAIISLCMISGRWQNIAGGDLPKGNHARPSGMNIFLMSRSRWMQTLSLPCVLRLDALFY
jgi:hypothetical protein